MAVEQFLLRLAGLGYSIEPSDAEISAWILLGFQHFYVGCPLDGTSWRKELCWPDGNAVLVGRL